MSEKENSTASGTNVGQQLIARQEHSVDELTAKCGKRLHCYYWEPVTPQPRAIAVIVHGLAEHLACYEALARRLASESILAFGHDHVGHGQSEGVRIHVDSVDEYVDGVLHHIEIVKKRHPHVPVFAVGHSMGGMITLAAALKEPDAFNGVVLMGPLIHIDPATASPMRIRLAKVVSRIAPHLPVGSLDLGHVTRDTEMRQMLEKDPLRFRGGIKCKWATAVHEALTDINCNLETMRVPFLILHGDQDRLCNVEGSRDLYKKAASADKQLKIFPDAFHNLYIESREVREEALNDTISWIRQRLATI